MTGTEVFAMGNLVCMYERMTRQGVSQHDRLEQARKLCGDPAELARKFNADVEAFTPFDRRDEAFRGSDPDRDKKRFAPKSKTRVVAQALMTVGAGDRVDVEGRRELGFRYVDREIVTARAPGATFKAADGKVWASQNLPKLDLLLSNAGDRTPIIAELKVGDDRDPFYALIQALAHAAILATPNQLERLRRQYDGAFADDCKRDVYVVLAGAAEGSNWEEFDSLARDLSGELMRDDNVTRWVRRIESIRLQIGAVTSRQPLTG